MMMTKMRKTRELTPVVWRMSLLTIDVIDWIDSNGVADLSFADTGGVEDVVTDQQLSRDGCSTIDVIDGSGVRIKCK